MTQAVTVQSGPDIKVTDHSATVTWSTDVPAGTRLNYGTSEKLLSQRIEGEVTAAHTVQINDLAAGTTYFFSIGTARVQLATGKFATTGATSVKPTTTPSVAAVPKKPLLERLLPGLFSGAKTATATALPKPPPTRATWGSLDSLPDHFARHGGDFHAQSADDYAAQAWLFLQRAKAEHLPMKWDDSDSTLRIFDAKTGAFAAFDRHGKTRTYFKPSNPSYWQRQPGRVVQPAQLAF
jgi:hypothetical protein